MAEFILVLKRFNQISKAKFIPCTKFRICARLDRVVRTKVKATFYNLSSLDSLGLVNLMELSAVITRGA